MLSLVRCKVPVFYTALTRPVIGNAVVSRQYSHPGAVNDEGFDELQHSSDNRQARDSRDRRGGRGGFGGSRGGRGFGRDGNRDGDRDRRRDDRSRGGFESSRNRGRGGGRDGRSDRSQRGYGDSRDGGREFGRNRIESSGGRPSTRYGGRDNQSGGFRERDSSVSSRGERPAWARRSEDGERSSYKSNTQRSPERDGEFDYEEPKREKKLENWDGPKTDESGAPQFTREQKLAIKEQKATEITVHGFHACMSVFQRRPDDIAKVYFTDENKLALGEVLSYLAKRNIGYSMVDQEKIAKITGSDHHEGVAFSVKHKPFLSIDEAVQRGTQSSLTTKDLSQPCLLFLDNISNPHNIGSLLRTAAFFGVQTVFSYNNTASNLSNPLNPASYRTSQGGVEYVDIANVTNEQEALSVIKKLKLKGCKIISTTSHFDDSTSLYSPQAAKHLLPTHPIVLLLGNEKEGVSPALEAKADAFIRIPSSGWLESLNVSQAAAVIFGELWRSRGGSLAAREMSEKDQKQSLIAKQKWKSREPNLKKPGDRIAKTAVEVEYQAEIQSEVDRLALEMMEARKKKREGRLQTQHDNLQQKVDGKLRGARKGKKQDKAKEGEDEGKQEQEKEEEQEQEQEGEAQVRAQKPNRAKAKDKR